MRGSFPQEIYNMPDNNFILYGMQASLYTGKARAFMRRNRIPVIERGAGHPDTPRMPTAEGALSALSRGGRNQRAR